MTKYIKMTVSSNSRNIFSLPLCQHFLTISTNGTCAFDCLNLVYDISCIALPFDNVDKEFLKESHISGKPNQSLRFMAWIGPISSVFDILTYILLYFIIVPMIFWGIAMFMVHQKQQPLLLFSKQVGLSIYVVSNHGYPHVTFTKLPFIQSHPALSVVVTTLLLLFFVTSLPSVHWLVS